MVWLGVFVLGFSWAMFNWVSELAITERVILSWMCGLRNKTGGFFAQKMHNPKRFSAAADFTEFQG